MNLPTQYLSIIKLHYPDIKSNQFQVFDQGWDHLVVVVNQTQAFRFPRSKAYKQKLPIEAEFLNQLAPQSPVRIPKLTVHQESNIVYATYDFISGVKFKTDIRENFSPQELLAVAAQLGQFLTVLHLFPVKQAQQIGLETMQKTYWPQRFAQIKTRVFPLLTHKDTQRITKLFKSFIGLSQQYPKLVVGHGDISPEHIIVDLKTHTLSGIIDFGDVSIGDPAYDFQLQEEFGKQFLNTVYAHYKLSRDSNFEQRRQFYEYSRPVRELDNCLNRKEKPAIVSNYQNQLTKFIQSHSLT